MYICICIYIHIYIYTCKDNAVEAEEDQSNLLSNIVELNNKSRPRLKVGRDKKRDAYESAYALYKGLNAFKSGVFSVQATYGKGLKILTPEKYFICYQWLFYKI